MMIISLPLYIWILQKRLNETLKRDNMTGMTDTEIRDNLIELHVYYADLDYAHVEETPKYEFQDIISNVGGQLGMWIGVSALSIAEVIELFIIVFNFLINK
ncbi:FMRFamide-activated amiloride-sensitive sodium channel-like, partial [Actinia tenebrosa]|uniref:FMRFamide-activated amiloride-sensitive sodium channel-like n=1 Tax=Actinia tenebrosa TaxID=6105 RepID=A0A6P8HSG8_ACTTE